MYRPGECLAGHQLEGATRFSTVGLEQVSPSCSGACRVNWPMAHHLASSKFTQPARLPSKTAVFSLPGRLGPPFFGFGEVRKERREVMVVEEEIAPDLVSIVLPTVLGVAMVLVTVAIVFWIGSGTQRSYEEAKLQASRKAEEALKEKEHISPRAKKPRKNFRKKKPGETQEEPEPLAPRKGILKVPSASGVEPMTPDRPVPNKVEFKLDMEDGGGEEDTSRSSLPTTPYPSKDAALSSAPQRPGLTAKPPPPRPVFEEEPEVAKQQRMEAKPPPAQPREKPQNRPSQPPPPPSQQPPKAAAKAAPTTNAPPPTATAKKTEVVEVKKKGDSAPSSKKLKGGRGGKSSAVTGGKCLCFMTS